MKYFTNSVDLKYTWSQVCGAFFSRYPNPSSKHVLSDDIISREVMGPVVKTVRVIVKKNKITEKLKWLFRGGQSEGLYIEESYVNRETRSIISYTRTFSYRSLGLFDERCSYTPSQDNNLWTCLQREAFVTASSRYTKPFEWVVVKKYGREAKKSTAGLNYVLQQLYPVTADKTVKAPTIRLPKLPLMPKKVSCQHEETECDEE